MLRRLLHLEQGFLASEYLLSGVATLLVLIYLLYALLRPERF